VLQNPEFLIAVGIDGDDIERAKEILLLVIDCADGGCITDASAALIMRRL